MSQTALPTLPEPTRNDPCPKCGGPFTVTPNAFYFRDRYFSGLVCKPCNSLWNNPEDDFLAATRAADQLLEDSDAPYSE